MLYYATPYTNFVYYIGHSLLYSTLLRYFEVDRIATRFEEYGRRIIVHSLRVPRSLLSAAVVVWDKTALYAQRVLSAAQSMTNTRSRKRTQDEARAQDLSVSWGRRGKRTPRRCCMAQGNTHTVSLSLSKREKERLATFKIRIPMKSTCYSLVERNKDKGRSTSHPSTRELFGLSAFSE